MSFKNQALSASVAAIAMMTNLSASAFSISDDFSANANPSGVWTYGWLTAIDGTFTKYTVQSQSTSGGTIDKWNGLVSDPFSTPLIWNNASGAAYAAGTVSYESGWAGFHPGPSNQLSTFRFTTPSAGSYTFALDFQGADFVGTTSSDVHVHTNSGDLFSAVVSGFGDVSRKSFDATVALTAGQVVDITVGYGGNNYLFDSTAVRGSILAVPEPQTFALLLVGLGLVGTMVKRKNKLG